MKMKKHFAVVAAVFLVLSAAAIGLRSYAASKSSPVTVSSVSTGMQNDSSAYDSEKKITLVGTHQNKALAFDASGKKLWEFEASGSVVRIEVNSKLRKAYIGDSTGKVSLLNIDSGKQEAVADIGTRLYDFDVTADGSRIVMSAGPSPTAHYMAFFDDKGNQGKMVKVGATAKAIAFTFDEKSVLVGTNRSEIIRYDLDAKEIGRIKMNREIISIRKAPETKQYALLTQATEYYYLSEDLKTVRSGRGANTATAIGVTDDGKYTFVGTFEGFLYIFSQNDSKLMEARISNPITGFLFTDDKILISSYNGALNEMSRGDLDAISMFSSMGTLLLILCIVLPVLFVVFLFLAVDRLSDFAKRFGCAFMKHRTAYFMLLPTFALLLLFNYYPTFIAFTRSFTDWSRNTQSVADLKWVGFDNYKTMFQEAYFFTGVKNLIIITLTNFVKALTIPLLVAKLVFSMRGSREKYWFRFFFVLPMVVPGVVGALIWQNIYDPNIGLINTLCRTWGHPEWTRVWLGDPATAIWAIVFMGFPFISAFNFLVYYGGLINIDSSLLEAAKVDGSNAFYNFFRIQLPLLAPQFKLIIILTFINSIQDYAGIYILTGGGPGTATYVPGLELYYNATRFGRYGYACALGVVMFIFILIGTIANMKLQKANSEEGQ